MRLTSSTKEFLRRMDSCQAIEKESSTAKERFNSFLHSLCHRTAGHIWDQSEKQNKVQFVQRTPFEAKSNKLHASLTRCVLPNWKSCTSQCVVTLYYTALLLLSPPPSRLLRQQMGNLNRNVTSVQIHTSPHLLSTISTLDICYAFRSWWKIATFIVSTCRGHEDLQHVRHGDQM